MDSQTLHHLPITIKSPNNRQLFTITVIYHPDVSRIGEQAKCSDNTLELSRVSPLFSAHHTSERRPLSDMYISRTPLTFTKQGKDWHIDAQASTTTLATAKQLDVNSLIVSPTMLNNRCLITLAGRVVLMLHQTTAITPNTPDNLGLVGVSDNLSHVRSLITKSSQLNAPLLIRGESGTGKELIAQALHHVSPRNNKRLINVNLASIANDLVTSELFGSVKGAYTGAVTRDGLFKQADQSSLFLDEIGEAAPEVQVALLRSLESGTIQPVGSEQELKLDVRFIAATDANLEQMIDKETFRMPLLQRLSGLTINVAPLRERPEDIGLLLTHFLQQQLADSNQIDKLINNQEACYYWAWFFAQCAQLAWPGNVRQLKNIATQLTMQLIGVNDLSKVDWRALLAHVEEVVVPTATQDAPCAQPPKRKPRDISDNEVLEVLEKFRWQIKLAAAHLNISRASLYLKMDSNPNIRRASHLSSSEISSSFDQYAGNIDDMVANLRVSKPALRRRLNEIGLAY